MTNEEAIQAIKSNYPPERYTMLREALDMAMTLLAAESKPMIEWIKYDRNSREIESHVNYLITDGLNIWLAQHAKLINNSGYGWHGDDRCALNLPVTHYAHINLPGEDTDNA